MRSPIPGTLASMRTRRPGSGLRIVLLAVVALGAAAVAVAIAAGEGEAQHERAAPPAAAWKGLVGGSRPEVSVGQRTIVLMRVPSLAERLALQGGRATEARLKHWQTVALAAQEQLLAGLAAQGVRIRPEYRYTRVLSGFSAALDPRAIALLERSKEVRAVYPVRIAYPATVSADLLEEGEVAAGAAHRPEPRLPGFDGLGVTVALLDTGVDLRHRYLGRRALGGIDIVDGDDSAQAEVNPDTGELERHGTQLAGVVAGANGPSGLRGVAPAATILPVRVAGWQRDSRGAFTLYGRTDQLIAGLERAVDPNDDGDTHDAARIAVLGVAEPFGAFDDSPAAQAVVGALRHDTLVVAPAGNDGPAGVSFGSISGPGGSRSALTVGAVDPRPRLEDVRVVLRSGLRTVLDRRLPLAGAVAPDGTSEYPLARPALPETPGGLEPPPLELGSFFDDAGYSRVAGRAALVPAGSSPRDAAAAAARAGAAAVVLYGVELPSGGVGLTEDVDVPVVAVSDAEGRELVESLRSGGRASVTLGSAREEANAGEGAVAPFSSRGLAFDGRLKPDLAASGVSLLTAEPGRNAEAAPRYGTASGSSVSAAVVAGAAALLVQARPWLDAVALKGLLVGAGRPLPGSGLTAQGGGLVDVGAAAATEAAAAPATLTFPPARGAGWRATRVLTLRNLSTRTLRLAIATPRAGPVVAAASPRRLTLLPGRRAQVYVTARLAYAPHGREPIEGALRVTTIGGGVFRVPWLVVPAEPIGPLLGDVQLSAKSFKPSDTAPTVVSLTAGRISGRELRPLALLDLELWRDERKIGVLVRLRDLLPGRYAFGLTGRDPAGKELDPGRYRLLLRAFPTDGSGQRTRSLEFTIR
jgi:Subtilase family/PA domain